MDLNINKEFAVKAKEIDYLKYIYNLDTADYIPLHFLSHSLFDIDYENKDISNFKNFHLSTFNSNSLSFDDLYNHYIKQNYIDIDYFYKVNAGLSTFLIGGGIIFDGVELVYCKYIKKQDFLDILNQSLYDTLTGAFYDFIVESDFVNDESVRSFNKDINYHNYWNTLIEDKKIYTYVNSNFNEFAANAYGINVIDDAKEHDHGEVLVDTNNEYLESKIFSRLPNMQFDDIDGPENYVVNKMQEFTL